MLIRLPHLITTLCIGVCGSLFIGEITPLKAQESPEETETVETVETMEADSPSEVFYRAFFHNTKDIFYHFTIDSQATQFFGAFYRDNQIAQDAELLNGLYRDFLNQQLYSTPIVRTRDISNPFDTSLRENPSYMRTTP